MTKNWNSSQEINDNWKKAPEMKTKDDISHISEGRNA